MFGLIISVLYLICIVNNKKENSYEEKVKKPIDVLTRPLQRFKKHEHSVELYLDLAWFCTHPCYSSWSDNYFQLLHNEVRISI